VEGLPACVTREVGRGSISFRWGGKPSGPYPFPLFAPLDPPLFPVALLAIVQGPDTSGQWWYLRSVDSTRPIDDESQLGWTLQIFRIGGNIGSTPSYFAPSTLIGEASQVPTIDFDNANEFRRYIPGCPNENFAWRAYGQLEVVTGGNYNLCTTSDDGSMLYIDLTPGDKNPSYALVINNDGLHGARQYCKTMALQPGSYSTMVTGFQGPGAVVMRFNYNGPDTANQWVGVRSVDSSKPSR